MKKKPASPKKTTVASRKPAITATKNKASLKPKRITVLQVDDSDLFNFVSKVWDIPIGAVQNGTRVGSDSYYELIDVTDELDGIDKRAVLAFRKQKSGRGLGLSTLLNALCADKKIAAGSYLIAIGW